MNYIKVVLKICLLVCVIALQIGDCAKAADSRQSPTDADGSIILRKDLARRLDRVITHFKPDDDSVPCIYYVEFSNENIWNYRLTDTSVLVSYMVSNSKNIEGYKGIGVYKNHPLIIFDHYNYGESFYDKSKLINIPLDILKTPIAERSNALLFRLENGKMVDQSDIIDEDFIFDDEDE